MNIIKEKPYLLVALMLVLSVVMYCVRMEYKNEQFPMWTGKHYSVAQMEDLKNKETMVHVVETGCNAGLVFSIVLWFGMWQIKENKESTS